MNGDPQAIAIPAQAWLLALLLLAIEVATAPFSAATLDTARDLHWAWQIARGDAFPALGPRFADRFELGPIWFYLLSLPLLAGGGVTSASVFTALLAALKYPLALVLGNRLGGARLGVAWMCMLALPSLAWFTQMTWTHISPSLTAALLFGLALLADRRQPDSIRAVMLGTAIMLMLHAHPTLLALAWPALWNCWRGPDRIRRAFYMALPIAASLMPVVLAHWFAGGTTTLEAPEPVQITAALSTIPTLVWQTFVYGADSAIHLATSALPALRLPMQLLAGFAAAIGLIGLGIGLFTAPAMRRLAGLTVAMLAVYFVFVALARPVTWWYMMLGALAPASLLLALGWSRLPARAVQGLALAVLPIAAALLVGLLRTAVADTTRNFPPGLFNLKVTAEQRSISTVPWLPMLAQDRLARELCRADGGVVLHGTLGFVLDPTGRILHGLHCPEVLEWRLGGQDTNATHAFALAADIPGLPVAARAFGLRHYAVASVLYPEEAPLPLARAANEKLRGWASGPARTHVVRARLPAGTRLAIANPFHWQAELEIISVRADGQDAQRVAGDVVTQVFAAAPDPARPEVASTYEWIVRFRFNDGFAPDLVALRPGASSARPQ